ncbi:MAG: hypothetical protein H3C47_13370, partial [Candidatus Cloacimonetes bacterium]|nr:hypothetical protein [Candidatus Cloacimonadota bacterium]
MKHWKIKLRPLTPWTSETLLKIWQQPLNKMETLGGGEFCEEDPYIKGLIPVLKSLSCERILGSIKATRHLRLFLQLWANRGSEFQSFPDSIEEFQILQNLPFEPTRSCYIATIYLWLDSYHRPVEFRKNLVAYIKFLSLKIRPPKNIDSQVGRLLQYQDDILAENGPLRVVIFAAKRNLTLENALKQMGLELRNKCSFIVACYSLHY